MKRITVPCLKHHVMALVLNQMTRTTDSLIGRKPKSVQHMWHRLVVLCTLAWHRFVTVWCNVKVHENKVISLVDTKRREYILNRKKLIRFYYFIRSLDTSRTDCLRPFTA